MKIIIGSLVLAGMLVASQVSQVPTESTATIKDSQMAVLSFEDLRYPPFAREAQIQGVVVVRAELDNDGKVVEGVALSGSTILVPDSIANAKKWRFRPNAPHAAIIVYSFTMPTGAACMSNNSPSFSILQAPNLVTVTGCSYPIQG